MAEQLKFQVPTQGFGAYCKGIIPDDQSVLAGALSTSLQQINNINSVDFESFAQIVFSLETNNGLPLSNGTNIPTNEFLVNSALSKVALGSAVYGTYATSDFIGTMTGLPYPLRDLKGLIQLLQTNKLDTIYDQLYLAVDWHGALGVVSIDTQAIPAGIGIYDWQYKITNVTLSDAGGGYGRGGAPTPSFSITDNGTGYYSGTGGVSVSLSINSNDQNIPNGYGSLLIQVTGNPGSWVTYAVGQASPTPIDPGLVIEIECPPDATLAVQTNGSKATGGTNNPYGTVAWTGLGSGMDQVVDDYITQANDEIYNIQTLNASNFNSAKLLNIQWNVTGTALKIEQRSRYTAAPPVPIPYYPYGARYPQVLYNFVDTIPSLAQDTEPHGPAQSLEQIADLCTVGGQSLVAMMRQERNQIRLGSVGIELENNIVNELTPQQEKILQANGTLPEAVEGIETPVGNFTLPAYADKENCDGNSVVPLPVGYFDPNDLDFKYTDNNQPGNLVSLLNLASLGPFGDLTGPKIINGENVPIVQVGLNVASGPAGGTPSRDLGLSGSLWPMLPLLPPNLLYNSGTLIPGNYNVNQAIDDVVRCNCDCWL